MFFLTYTVYIRDLNVVCNVLLDDPDEGHKCVGLRTKLFYVLLEELLSFNLFNLEKKNPKEEMKGKCEISRN